MTMIIIDMMCGGFGHFIVPEGNLFFLQHTQICIEKHTDIENTLNVYRHAISQQCQRGSLHRAVMAEAT